MLCVGGWQLTVCDDDDETEICRDWMDRGEGAGQADWSHDSRQDTTSPSNTL